MIDVLRVPNTEEALFNNNDPVYVENLCDSLILARKKCSWQVL